MCLQNRDVELRNLAESVMGNLFRSVIGNTSIRDYLVETITGQNRKGLQKITSAPTSLPTMYLRNDCC